MQTIDILKDIGTRCQGDIYLGVVGPVRTGKSSFIKRFMEIGVIPYIEDIDERKRAIDELPQSGVGKMIMTVEPKFVPNNAAKIFIDEHLNVHVRMVDCVGYVIDGAKGYSDEQGIRYVKTPWYSEEIPFIEAVGMLVGKGELIETKNEYFEEDNKISRLILPEKNTNNNIAISYLKSRGIDQEIIEEDGKAEIQCQFCNKLYNFNKEELENILKKC